MVMIETGILLKSHYVDHFSTRALMEQFGISQNTVSKYRQMVLADPEWQALNGPSHTNEIRRG